MSRRDRLLLLHESLTGHREDYIRLFGSLLGAAGRDVETRGLAASDVFRREPLFSTMLEEHTFRFAAIAATRALLGRRSATLLFRPSEAMHGRSLRLRLKRLMLGALKQLPGVSLLTILPMAVDPAFAKVATGWIYDPQLWDLPDDVALPAPPLPLAALAGGRKLVCALGTLNRDKGFELFCDIWNDERIRDRYLFVSAGKVAGSLGEQAAAFAASGGVLLDRFISNDELLGLYGASDLIWSCYAPHYDQASGIFGRAMQLGRRTLVRDGSFVEALARHLDRPAVVLPWDAAAAAAVLLATAPRAVPPVDRAALRAASLSRLEEALGLPPPLAHVLDAPPARPSRYEVRGQNITDGTDNGHSISDR